MIFGSISTIVSESDERVMGELEQFFRSRGAVTMAELNVAWHAEHAARRRLMSVRLLVDGVCVAAGHATETDFERVCREHDLSRHHELRHVFVNPVAADRLILDQERDPADGREIP